MDEQAVHVIIVIQLEDRRTTGGRRVAAIGDLCGWRAATTLPPFALSTYCVSSRVGDAASRTGSVTEEYRACVDHVWCSGLKSGVAMFSLFLL